MGLNTHTARLGTGTLLALLLGSYLFGASADADSGSRNISKTNGRIEVGPDQQVGDVSSVNGSIWLADGVSAGQVRTVNGSIHLDGNVAIRQARTVNGGIEVQDQVVITGPLSTTNGSIELEDGVRVEGELSTVNGAIRSGPGSTLADQVKTANGSIRLRNTQVGADVITSNGNIRLTEGTIVAGDLSVRGRQGWLERLSLWNNWHRPEIHIDSSSKVRGDIHLYREVELAIDPDAEVGEIIYHY
ncbi:MAG: hypothetical protein RLZZ385_1109 [Pseudomonadota bacterium]